MSTGLTAPLPEPEYEPRDSVSPEEYTRAAVEHDNHIPRAGVVPFVFDLMASSADVARIFERMVRQGGPEIRSKAIRDRVLRDLGTVLRNVILLGHFYKFSLRDIIDADYLKVAPPDDDNNVPEVSGDVAES